MIKKMKLNFANVKNSEQMHQLFKEEFGFPDFYGANIHALIDCLSSLRHPEDKMSKITLKHDEILVLECKGLTHKKNEFLSELMAAISYVNEREISRGNEPSLFVCPVVYPQNSG